MSRSGVAFWRLVDALCTGVLEVLAILAWYGVYQYVVENLPTAPEVGSSQLCGHLMYFTMAGEPPHRKPCSNSTGFCHWPLGADASGNFKAILATLVLTLNQSVANIFEYIGHEYLFGHSFVSIFRLQIYSDIRSCQIFLYE